MPDRKKSPWRPTLQVEQLAEPLAGAAVLLEIEGVSGPEFFEDPIETKERQRRAEIAAALVKASLEKIAAGEAGSIELSSRPEQFFDRARREAKPQEKAPQADAIREFLGFDHGDDILLSEQQLVHAAIRAAHSLGMGSDYGMAQLIRDGIRRVGQEMISNAVNQLNRKEGARPAMTAPGARWAAYEDAYLRLQSILGTEEWSYRKPYITVSTIVGAVAGPSTNSVQIRRWAEGTGKKIVGKPGKDEDQTAGGLIVDEKL